MFSTSILTERLLKNNTVVDKIVTLFDRITFPLKDIKQYCL